jgi:tRNA-dihydrouridine synthase
MKIIQSNSIKNIHKLSIAPMMDCTDRHFRMIMRKEKEFFTAQDAICRFFPQKKSMIVVQDGQVFGSQFKDQY